MNPIEDRSVRKNLSSLRALIPNPKVVFTDIDGTLVGPDGCLLHDGEGSPTSDAPAAMAELARSGIELVLLSGRRPAQVAPLAGILGASGYIAEMGTVVVGNARSAIHDQNDAVSALGDFPFEDETPYDAMLRTGAIQQILDRNPGRVEFHSPWHDERETSHLLRGEIDLDAENEALAGAGHGWCEIVDNGVIPHGYPGLEAATVHGYHIVPRGSGKDVGVRLWLDGRGIDPAGAIAIGDSRGDLAIAREVAAFLLMRNGVEDDPSIESQVRAESNVFVTDANYGPGWSSGIRAAVLGGQTGRPPAIGTG